MTGAVTFEFISSVVAVLLLAGTMLGWVLRALSKRDAEITANTRAIAELKLHIAEHYATKSGLNESLNRVHDALDRLTNRIDAILDSQPKTSRSRRSGEGG